jgi:hypothetical protein
VSPRCRSQVTRAAGAAFVLIALGPGAVSLAQVQVPQVQTQAPPALPKVPELPLPAVPSPPSVGGVVGGAPSGGGSLPAPGAGGGATGLVGAPSVGALSQAVPGAGYAAIGPSSSSSSAVDSTSPGAGRAERARRAEHRRSERRFRVLAARLAPCAHVLPRFQRRLLALRAGLGDARPHTRAQVARRFKMGEGAVRRAERRSLHRLMAADLVRGCARGSSTGDAVAGALGALPVLPSAVQAVADVLQSEPGSPERVDTTGDAGAVAGARESSTPDAGDGAQAATVATAALDQEADPSLLLAILGALGLAGLMLLSRRVAAAAADARGRSAPSENGDGANRSIEWGFVDELMKNNPDVGPAGEPPAEDDASSGKRAGPLSRLRRGG